MMTNLNARGTDSSDHGQSSGNMFTDRHGAKTPTMKGGAGARSRHDLEASRGGVNITQDTVTRIDREIELSPTSSSARRDEKGGGMEFGDRAAVVDAIPYQASNHRDEWDMQVPVGEQESQVNLVRNASWDRKMERSRI
jgi:hypothetical protein